MTVEKIRNAVLVITTYNTMVNGYKKVIEMDTMDTMNTTNMMNKTDKTNKNLYKSKKMYKEKEACRKYVECISNSIIHNTSNHTIEYLSVIYKLPWHRVIWQV